MVNNIKLKSALNIINIVLAGVVILGIGLATLYIVYQSNLDPVQYKGLSVDQSNIETSKPFSYTFSSCRTAGKEVTGNISRAFVPVEKVGNDWQPIKGRAPVLLFNTTNATNDMGCRVAHTTTIMPIMPTGDYQLRIIGNYTKLSILKPSVDEISSQTVHITESESDMVAPATTPASDNEAPLTNTTTTMAPPDQSAPTQTTTNNTTNNTTTNDNSTTTNVSPPPTQGFLQTILAPITGLINSL